MAETGTTPAKSSSNPPHNPNPNPNNLHDFSDRIRLSSRTKSTQYGTATAANFGAQRRPLEGRNFTTAATAYSESLQRLAFNGELDLKRLSSQPLEELRRRSEARGLCDHNGRRLPGAPWAFQLAHPGKNVYPVVRHRITRNTYTHHKQHTHTHTRIPPPSHGKPLRLAPLQVEPVVLSSRTVGFQQVMADGFSFIVRKRREASESPFPISACYVEG